MTQYQIVITTYYGGGHKEEKCSRCYNSVAELFTAEKAASTVQKALDNKFISVSVRKVETSNAAF